jgi:hypothetical protein
VNVFNFNQISGANAGQSLKSLQFPLIKVDKLSENADYTPYPATQISNGKTEITKLSRRYIYISLNYRSAGLS